MPMAGSASKSTSIRGEAWHCCLLYTLEDGEQICFRRRMSAPTNIKKPTHADNMSDWLRLGAENPHQQ